MRRRLLVRLDTIALLFGILMVLVASTLSVIWLLVVAGIWTISTALLLGWALLEYDDVVPLPPPDEESRRDPRWH